MNAFSSPEERLSIYLLIAVHIFSLLLSVCGFVLMIPSAHGEQLAHGCAPAVPPAGTGKSLPPPATPGIILINEVLPEPASLWNCSQSTRSFSQEMDSWCELYNPQNRPFDLYLSHTAISLDRGAHWNLLAAGSIIAARGYLVLFPEQVQPDITLISSVMLMIGNTLIDEQSIPVLAPDQSYARVPDGSQNWLRLDSPTIGASNVISPAQTNKPTPVQTYGTARSPATGGSDPDTPVSARYGTQPPIGSIQLPATTTATIATAARSPTATTPEQHANTTDPAAPDNWHILLIATSALALLSALIWCWRLFRTPC